MSRDPRGDPSWRRRDEAVEMSQINPGYLDDSIGRDPNHQVINMDGRIPLDRRHSDEGAGSGHSWARYGSARDAAELISELPSRQLDRLVSDTGKSIRARRKSQKTPLHGSLRGFPHTHRPTNDLTNSMARNEELMDELDGDIRTNEVLRGMSSHHLTDKRQIKHDVSEKRKERTLSRKKHQEKLGTWKHMKYRVGMTWIHFKNNLKEFGYSLELWKSLMKKVEGHFGTGVTSYFLFLKWIFLLNIPVFILTFGFVVLPQILFRYNPTVTNSTNTNVTSYPVPFSGEELLTGGGWFNDTELYYGYYTNEQVAVPLSNSIKYDMKYAYLFTCGGYYILCLFILAFSISKSYKKNYVEGSSTTSFYNVTRVLCGWDYNITSKQASDLKHKSFYNEMKEYLAGKGKKTKEKELSDSCKWFFIRVLTNLIVLGMIGGAGYLIYYILDKKLAESDVHIIGELTMPLVISSIHLVFPFIFARIGSLESYEKPKHELYVGMFRTMLLKGALLGILVSYWFRVLPGSVYCWETKVGNELYRLVLVDFIFILGATFFLEFIHKIMANYCCTEKLKEPEFDIGRNTLDLIYSQALCWFGTFYSPLLSVMMIVKLFILFYVKVVSVLHNCRPSSKAWRASRTHTIFLGFLFFFFLLTTVAVAVSIITITPSRHCGPFREQDKAYDVVTNLVNSWKDDYKVLHEIVKVISSPGVIAGVLVILCVGTYYMRIVMVGHKEMVTLLRHQLTMEGKDKAYLLRKLQKVRTKKKEKLVQIGQGTGRILSGTTGLREPPEQGGKRIFTRKLAETASASMENLAANGNGTPRSRRHQKK
ncbi:transmembrane channel-like protein 7 isoform X2 [Mytilus trossulus]|uniref:transmembrane channel-like protein 7 isoform X2 n=1 Tax=Mytilus trossulus TaxID=6551 RepID=UPI003007C75C